MTRQISAIHPGIVPELEPSDFEAIQLLRQRAADPK